jgi:hypothetical protein
MLKYNIKCENMNGTEDLDYRSILYWSLKKQNVTMRAGVKLQEFHKRQDFPD